MNVSGIRVNRNFFLIEEKINELKLSINAYLLNFTHRLLNAGLKAEIGCRIESGVKWLSEQEYHPDFPGLVKILRLYYKALDSIDKNLAIKTPEGSVQVNRFLFKASSKYLAYLLKDSKEEEISLECLSLEDCTLLCEYIQTGELKFFGKSQPVINLIYAAQKYGMHDLLAECEQTLIHYLRGFTFGRDTEKAKIADWVKLFSLPLPNLHVRLLENFQDNHLLKCALSLNTQMPFKKKESLLSCKDRLHVEESLNLALKESWKSIDFSNRFDGSAVFHFFNSVINQPPSSDLPLASVLFDALKNLFYSNRLDHALAEKVLKMAKRNPVLSEKLQSDTFELTLFDENGLPHVFRPEAFPYIIYTELFRTILTGPFEEAGTKKITCRLILSKDFPLIHEWVNDQNIKKIDSFEEEKLFELWSLFRDIGVRNFKPFLENVLTKKISFSNLTFLMKFAIEQEYPLLLNKCVRFMKRNPFLEDYPEFLTEFKSPQTYFESFRLYQQTLDTIALGSSSTEFLSKCPVLPGIKTLDLSSLKTMSEASFSECVRIFPHITILKMNEMKGMTEAGWSFLISFKQLRHIEFNIGTTRRMFEKIEILDLSGLHSLHLNRLMKNLPHLEKIKIKLPFTYLTWANDLRFFSSLPKSLEKIDISVFGEIPNLTNPLEIAVSVLGALCLSHFFLNTGAAETMLAFASCFEFIQWLYKNHIGIISYRS